MHILRFEMMALKVISLLTVKERIEQLCASVCLSDFCSEETEIICEIAERRWDTSLECVYGVIKVVGVE